MATRKEPIDIEYDEPQQEAVSDAVESNDPYESQDPADWVPPMTVRIYPISKPRTKLLATANVNIAKSFAVQGFRIYDSKNGLFVKEPQRSYVKNGTEMTSSVFFPITKEARDALYSQILNSYEMVMEQQERQHPQQKDELEELLEDGDLPFAQPYEAPPPPKRIYQSDLPSRAIAVYLYLRGRANREGACWPAIPTMARELKMSESTVRRGVRDLERAGFLAVEERFRWNKADSSNLYVLVGQSSEKQLLSK